MEQFQEKYLNVDAAMVSTRPERQQRKYRPNEKEGYRNSWDAPLTPEEEEAKWRYEDCKDEIEEDMTIAFEKDVA